MTDPIHYRICPLYPRAHRFAVSVTVAEPDPEGQVFSLPAWIPGSYMIREFARNIVSIRAEADGKAVALEKLDKHSWRAARVPAGRALTLHYEVYAWDLSVRAAHLDHTHAFFNGTSVFLKVHGHSARPCTVDIQPPVDERLGDWRVITALPRASGRGAAKAYGFGLYRAADYDELIDHPVEMGRFTLGSFQVGEVVHDVALTGRHDCDMARLTADLKRICAWQVDLFGAPAPMDYYAFLVMIVGDGYGGLEHRASTALLAGRADLPYAGMKAMTKGYRQFLGLCSHEYFHSWNVKRIKPAAFTPYDLAAENYTRLLWAFEGFTSYYDDLALVRSGVIGVDDYLALIGQTISNVLRTPGRRRQSVTESSFDAWIKYYRQDENAPNAIVSYYAKGALVALALDLQLRAASAGQKSLDDVMRLLWQHYGQTGIGVPEDGVFAAVARIGGTPLARWLRRTVEGTDDLPLARLLKPFGIVFTVEPASTAPWLGAKLAADGEPRLVHVYDDGPAQRAGLSAGDVLVALDGLKVDAHSLGAMLARRRPGERIELHAFRRDELLRFELELAAPPADQISLKPAAKASAAARRLRRGWLGR